MSCSHCGRWGNDCTIAVCNGCGVPQCHGNGGRAGSCRVCGYGHLEGWSRGLGLNASRCGYKGCDGEAVFIDRVPRVGRCCRKCWDRPKISLTGRKVTLREYVIERVKADAWRYIRLREGQDRDTTIAGILKNLETV